MKGSPGRKMRRAAERAVIKASQKQITEAAVKLLRDNAEKFRKELDEAELEKGRHEKVDPKEKAVRSGPRTV